MQTITIESAMAMWGINSSLTALADNRLPFRLMLRVNRTRRAVSEVFEAFSQEIAPLIPEGKDLRPGQEGWNEFVEAAEGLWEPTEVKIKTLRAKDLEPLGDRQDFAFRELDYEMLRSVGIVVE